MAYCTVEDIKTMLPEEQLIELTDDSQPPVEVQTSIVQDAISYSDAIIDGFLGSKYTVPLSPVSELIKNYSVDISCFRLYSRRPDVDMPEGIKTNYENALKFLEKIQKGIFQLEGVSGEASSGLGEYVTNKTASSKVFNADTWSLYDGY